MRRYVLILVATAAACGGDNTAATDAGPAPDAPVSGAYRAVLEPLGSAGGDQLGPVAVVSATEIIACSESGPAQVYDVSDPAGPAAVRPIGGPCVALAVVGSTAFLAETDGLAARDTTTGALLYRVPGRFRGIAATSEAVFATRGPDGVVALAWNGSALSEVGTVSTGFVNAWGAALDGTSLYVTDAAGAIARIDATAPASLSVVATAPLPPSPQAVAVDGDRLYVAAGAGGILAVDAATLSVVHELDTPGSVTQVAIAGERVLAADWGQLFALDLELTPVAQVPVTDGVRGVAATDDMVFAAGWTGVQTLQIHPDRAAPSMWISEDPVVFRGSATAARSLIVRNFGREPLAVTDIAVDDAAIGVDRTSLAVEPGEAAVVELVFPGGDAERIVQLTLASDDPLTPARAVPVTAGAPELAVGEPVPDVLAALLGGGEWRSSQQGGRVVFLAYFATY